MVLLPSEAHLHRQTCWALARPDPVVFVALVLLLPLSPGFFLFPDSAVKAQPLGTGLLWITFLGAVV